MLTSCIGFVIVGRSLLIWKTLEGAARLHLTAVRRLFTKLGDVPNVACPCAALYDQPSGRIAIYYGGAETVTPLAFARLDEVIRFIKEDSAA